MRALGLVSLLLALGAGYFYYDGYFATASTVTPPKQEIDVVSIRTELQTLGQAERQYLITHSRYGTLDDLKQEDLLPAGLNRRGYTLTSSVDGSQGFTITATPTDPAKAGWPTLSIDHTMQITSR